MKAQIFSADATIALFVFLLLIAGIFYTTSAGMGGQRELLTKAEKISDFLVYQKFGTENNLNCEDVADFSGKSYSEQKKELGADFSVEFENKTKICSGKKISAGLSSSNKTNIASVARIVLIEEETIKMQVKVYE